MVRTKIQFKAGSSVLFGWLTAVCDRISAAFSHGLLSRMLTSYDEREEKLKESAISRTIAGETLNKRGVIRRVRAVIARQFEESLLLGWLSRLMSYIMSCSVRSAGAFFATYGAYTTLIYIIKCYALLQTETATADLICGLIITVISLPMLFSGRSLSSAMGRSAVMRVLLVDICGIPPEHFDTRSSARGSQSISVICGIVFGMLTYFISPLYLIYAIALAAALILLLSYPEAGVVTLIAAAPFMNLFNNPSIMLGIMTLLSVLGYAVKLLRGKRVFSFGYSDLPVLLLWLAMLCGGITKSEMASGKPAFLTAVLMLIYFLVVNLVRDRRWLRSCMTALVASATVTSFIGVAEYLLGLASPEWLDTSLYAGIIGRTTSTFANPNVLAVYLIMAIPAAIALFLNADNWRLRLIAAGCGTTMLLCVIFTWSRGAWLGLAVGLILFMLSVSARTLAFIPPAAGCVVAAAFAFPDSFGARLYNLITISDTTNYYRLYTWRGVWNMLRECWLTGVGYGETAFRSVYVNFAYAGIEATPHAHSLYLQITAETGVIGLILLLAAVVATAEKCYTFFTKPAADRETRLICLACMCGAVALLVAGIFDYTWYNYRVFFVFWCIIGLTGAAVNAGRREMQNGDGAAYSGGDNTSDRAEITLHLHGGKDN